MDEPRDDKPPCGVCEAPGRRLWPPRGDRPPFKTMGLGGSSLQLCECPACGRLWSEHVGEPWFTYAYGVPWPWKAEDWFALDATGMSPLLHRWQNAAMARAGSAMTAEDRDAWIAHLRRGGSFSFAPDFGASTEEVPLDAAIAEAHALLAYERERAEEREQQSASAAGADPPTEFDRAARLKRDVVNEQVRAWRSWVRRPPGPWTGDGAGKAT